MFLKKLKFFLTSVEHDKILGKIWHTYVPHSTDAKVVHGGRELKRHAEQDNFRGVPLYNSKRHYTENRILELADIFSIDVCVYVVIQNHYHMVLYITVIRNASGYGVILRSVNNGSTYTKIHFYNVDLYKFQP